MPKTAKKPHEAKVCLTTLCDRTVPIVSFRSRQGLDEGSWKHPAKQTEHHTPKNKKKEKISRFRPCRKTTYRLHTDYKQISAMKRTEICNTFKSNEFRTRDTESGFTAQKGERRLLTFASDIIIEHNRPARNRIGQRNNRFAQIGKAISPVEPMLPPEIKTSPNDCTEIGQLSAKEKLQGCCIIHHKTKNPNPPEFASRHIFIQHQQIIAKVQICLARVFIVQ